MGKKAKIKKIRRELQGNSKTEKNLPKTQFVEQLNKLGYQLEEIKRSPEVPTENIKPQL